MSNEKKLVPKLRFEDYKSEQEWEKLRVEDLGEIVTGTTPPTNDNSNYGGQYLFISPVDIQENRYVDNTVTRLSKKGFEKGRILPEGTTLFVSIGSTIGKVAQIRKKAVTNQQINAIIPNPKYNPNFILSLFKKYTKEIRKISSAQAVPIINKNTLSNYGVITTKNIKEQQQIGTFFKKIDKMIQLQQSKVNKVKDLKSAYLSEMFPKEGEKYPKKRFEGFNEPWKEYNLGEVAQIKTGNTNVQDAVLNGKYTFFDRSTDIKRIDKYYYDEETIIYPGEGSEFYPRHFSGKYALHQRAYSITSDIVNLEYLTNMMMLRNNHFTNNAVGSTVKSLRMENFINCKIFIPPIGEQKKIAKLFKNINSQISIEEEKLEKLEKLKQAYLNDMFV